ncbi:shikimate dehydrogenase [Pseudoclavibacter sp. Z016]|nr:shikimate dehydrogenase [Pseudoclavibacter sp. Z016]PPF75815.1 shikimate dehydrogenase [Pseudoclavibacter sp. Z016]
MINHRATLMGLVGTGVTPSLTPPMHMAEARAQGMDLLFRPLDLTTLDLEPERLPEILDWAERLGFDALNITHPCKQSVIPLLDRIDPLARALGAVNTVLLTSNGRVGYNTDTTGFEGAFRGGLGGVQTNSVVLLGAGGAGSAVADALIRVGTRLLTIVDLDAQRAEQLAQDLAERHATAAGGPRIRGGSVGALPELLSTADGVVHCTPVGMHDHPGIPFPAELLRPELWVADIVYRPLETQLILAARALGCRTLDGGAMAVGQAVDTFRLVTGRDADATRMHQHFQSLVNDEEARSETWRSQK